MGNYVDPIVPALAIPRSVFEPVQGTDGSKAGESLTVAMKGHQDLDISDVEVSLPQIPLAQLPMCPECQHLLRPGVVWFGESLPTDILQPIDDYFDNSEAIELMLVIGTSAQVWPAAGYVDEARAKGARIAVINMDEDDLPPGEMTERDWVFKGDAGILIPQLLAPLVGDACALNTC